MSEYDVWRVFESIRLHYAVNTFDIRKYGFESKTMTPSRYESFRHKSFVQRLASMFQNKENLILFLAVGFFEHNTTWASEFEHALPEVKQSFVRAKRVVASPEYWIKEESKHIDASISPTDLVHLINKKKITPEGLIISEKAFGLLSSLNWIDSNLIHKMLRRRFAKYSAFIDVPQDQLERIAQLATIIPNKGTAPLAQEI